MLHASAGKQHLLADSSVAYTFQIQSSDHAGAVADESGDKWSCSALVCSQHYSQRHWASGQVDAPSAGHQRFFTINHKPFEFKTTQQILTEGHAAMTSGGDNVALDLQVVRHRLRWNPSSFVSAEVIESTEVTNLANVCKCMGRKRRKHDKCKGAAPAEPEPDASEASSDDSDSDASILEALARELDKGRTSYSDEDEWETGKDDKDPCDAAKIDELSHAVAAASSKYKSRAPNKTSGDGGSGGGVGATASTLPSASAATAPASSFARSAYLCPVVPSTTSTSSSSGGASSSKDPWRPDTRVFRPRSEDPQIDAVTSVDSIQSKLTSRNVKEAVRAVGSSRSRGPNISTGISLASLPSSVRNPADRHVDDLGGDVRPAVGVNEETGSTLSLAIPEEVMAASLKQAQDSNAGLLFVEEVAEESLLGLASFPPLDAAGGASAGLMQPEFDGLAESLRADKEREKCINQMKSWAQRLLETALAFEEFIGSFFTDWQSLPDNMYRRMSLVLFLDESDVGGDLALA